MVCPAAASGSSRASWPWTSEAAKEGGYDVSQIHSVASFFVSRVDTGGRPCPAIASTFKSTGREGLCIRVIQPFQAVVSEVDVLPTHLEPAYDARGKQ